LLGQRLRLILAFDILQAMDHPQLFGRWFKGSSWNPWRAFLAALFALPENDRSQTRQFISLLRRLAIVSNGSVVLLSHPSLTGINSGSGISGSTAWHNSVRSRM
jgi:hypothetical protein